MVSDTSTLFRRTIHLKTNVLKGEAKHFMGVREKEEVSVPSLSGLHGAKY